VGDIDEQEPVRSTSDWMASVRQQESHRDDAYLIDPYAAALTGDSLPIVKLLTDLGGPSEVVITRGRFGDAMLREALLSGVGQVAILAAGSDTRAFRLDFPRSVTVYELDLPGQLGAKFAALTAAGAQPTGRLVMVEADLRGDWTVAVKEAGLLPGKPTAWLVEGLFYYLEPKHADALIRKISELSPRGSRLAFDVPHPRYYFEPANEHFLDYMAERGSPFVLGVESPEDWLRPYGWDVSAYMAEDMVAGRVPGLPPAPQRLSHPDRPIWHVSAISAGT
jgi:methyltransferase (TIGR00027 family)